MSHRTSSLPRFVLTEQCISKAFIGHCVCFCFPRRNLLSVSVAQVVRLPGQLSAVALSPLVVQGYDGPRRRTCGTPWGEVGRTMFPGDSHRSASPERGIGSIHPAPIPIHHFIFCGCQVSGVPCWLKGPGLLPGGSYGGFQHFLTIL